MEITKNNFHQFFLAKELICACIMLTVFYIRSFAGQKRKRKQRKAMPYQNNLKIHTYKPLYRKNKSAL